MKHHYLLALIISIWLIASILSLWLIGENTAKIITFLGFIVSAVVLFIGIRAEYSKKGYINITSYSTAFLMVSLILSTIFVHQEEVAHIINAITAIGVIGIAIISILFLKSLRQKKDNQ